MKVADQHKKLEEYFHGAGNNDPDFVSLVDKLLSGLSKKYLKYHKLRLNIYRFFI